MSFPAGFGGLGGGVTQRIPLGMRSGDLFSDGELNYVSWDPLNVEVATYNLSKANGSSISELAV
jgi:hypothetical protein